MFRPVLEIDSLEIRIRYILFDLYCTWLTPEIMILLNWILDKTSAAWWHHRYNQGFRLSLSAPLKADAHSCHFGRFTLSRPLKGNFSVSLKRAKCLKCASGLGAESVCTPILPPWHHRLITYTNIESRKPFTSFSFFSWYSSATKSVLAQFSIPFWGKYDSALFLPPTRAKFTSDFSSSLLLFVSSENVECRKIHVREIEEERRYSCVKPNISLARSYIVRS